MLMALILLPSAELLSPGLLLDNGMVYLVYLPLALCIALLLIFDWHALPGMIIAVFGYITYFFTAAAALIVTLIFLFSCLIPWSGYRLQVPTKWGIAPGRRQMLKSRMFWLGLLIPLFFISGLQLAVFLQLLPASWSMVTANGDYLHLLINLQATTLANFAMLGLFYHLIRITVQPRCLMVLWRRLQTEMAPDVTLREIGIWFATLAVMVGLALYPPDQNNNIFLSDYSLILLLPVMLYCAIRFGYQVILILWPITLLVVFCNYPDFIQWNNLPHNLAFINAMMLMFTISLLLVSSTNALQRQLHQKAQEGALNDPVIMLPNLVALKRDLSRHSHSMLCFLDIDELDLLSSNYGMQVRIRFKQELAKALHLLMSEDEDVYNMPGHDLVLRLNVTVTNTLPSNQTHEPERIKAIVNCLDNFRLIWDGMLLHPHVGVAYCTVPSPVTHLYQLLGKLSTIAQLSLRSGKPETLHHEHQQLQLDIKHKIELLHRIQYSLDNDCFILMAQPISGVRGEHYYEILLRMPDEHGKIIQPNLFFPVVNEFGLSYEVDLWVLRHTLIFMDKQRDKLPGLRFAVNLSALSLCRPKLGAKVKELLDTYHIEPYQLVFEITESHFLQHIDYARIVLNELQEIGCFLAIDDFGTGYASYQRLKELPVNILKIDGSFVNGMLNNKLDFEIIASICRVAHLKNLMLVAEYVETPEQYDALKALGIDYMQGYLIGKPQVIDTLVDNSRSDKHHIENK